jgi:hypothetical protein
MHQAESWCSYYYQLILLEAKNASHYHCHPEQMPEIHLCVLEFGVWRSEVERMGA